jgi:hypothetical protein
VRTGPGRCLTEGLRTQLKWSLPEETGGLPILHYTLFMRPPPPGHEGPTDTEVISRLVSC